MGHVVQSSKMMSKVKIKMKGKIKSSNPALQPDPEPSKEADARPGQGGASPAVHSEDSNDGKSQGNPPERPRPTNNELPGMTAVWRSMPVSWGKLYLNWPMPSMSLRRCRIQNQKKNNQRKMRETCGGL